MIATILKFGVLYVFVFVAYLFARFLIKYQGGIHDDS